MTGSIINKNEKRVLLYRGKTETGDLSATLYLPGTKFKVGIKGSTPVNINTDLAISVPISNGTVNDNGDNTLTGSDGGDNTTDNAITYKEGAGETDAKAQNLIANNTNATKTWTIADLSALGTIITQTEPFGLWLYILDAPTLAKFLTSGTALEIKLGSDSSNYYSKTFEVSDLSTGWNWITSNTTNVEDLSETGTVAGNVDTFIIEITTNNATDAFIAGDVIYDLLRTWATTDLIKDFVTGYPIIDYVNLESTTRCYLTSLEANGFLLTSRGTFNEDTSPLLLSEDNFTGDSKSNTDEFAYVVKDRML